MLRGREIAEHAARRGVPETQIRLDELVSHILATLPDKETWTFIGGTALCRTHLAGFRLSEDIDLLVPDVSSARGALTSTLPSKLRREHPDATIGWERDGGTWVGWLRTLAGLTVRLQLVAVDDSYARYPTEIRPVELRYRDLPDTVDLRVPTAAGAAAMKLNAWADRGAVRDLCDLFGLLQAGFLDHVAWSIARAVAPAVQPHSFDVTRMPTQEQWQTALRAQMRTPPNRELAFHRVRVVVADLAGWERPQWRHELTRVEDEIG